MTTPTDMVALLDLREIVRDFFKNREKENAWFTTQNPLLGGITPDAMIDNGQVERLLKIVKEWRAGEMA